MKRTQNEKISQIKIETLVVGMGKKPLCKGLWLQGGLNWPSCWYLATRRKDFNTLTDGCETSVSSKKKTEVIIGFEPTGHYCAHSQCV